MAKNADSIREIKLKDKEYPAILREIPYPPKKLRIWGNFPKTDHYLSVVGTRRNSAFGEEILRNIIGGLAPHGFTIVSGMAVGIDTIAHKAALENNLKTVAVLGSGLSREAFYPQKNWKVAEEIASRGGAIISEYDDDFKATLWSFPQRNRVISGLSPATLIVEAPEKSGALITARFALDQNRDILAVPGSPFAANAQGTNRLIKMGAALIQSADDILILYNLTTAPPLGGSTAKWEISPTEQKIMEALGEPLDMDALIRQSGLPAAQAQSLISFMEIRGIIKKIGASYTKTV